MCQNWWWNCRKNRWKHERQFKTSCNCQEFQWKSSKNRRRCYWKSCASLPKSWTPRDSLLQEIRWENLPKPWEWKAFESKNAWLVILSNIMQHGTISKKLSITIWAKACWRFVHKKACAHKYCLVTGIKNFPPRSFWPLWPWLLESYPTGPCIFWLLYKRDCSSINFWRWKSLQEASDYLSRSLLRVDAFPHKHDSKSDCKEKI